MSKRVLFSWRHAIQQSSLNSTTKLVLFNLSIYMNDRGDSCFPSIGTQAKCTGLTERAVYAALKKAVDAGYLKRCKVFSGKMAHNNYIATTPEDTKIESVPLNEVQGEPDSPLNEVQVPPESGSGVPLNEVHPNSSIELSNELSNKKTKAKKVLIEQWEAKNGELHAGLFDEYAKRHGFHTDEIVYFVEKFRANCMANGRVYVDFAKAFMSWDWDKNQNPAKQKPRTDGLTPQERNEKAMREAGLTI